MLGAAIGYYLSVPNRVTACIMAFGSGVLISALLFELMEEAFNNAGQGPHELASADCRSQFSLGSVIQNLFQRE